jgi:hypothetical protein
VNPSTEQKRKKTAQSTSFSVCGFEEVSALSMTTRE